VSNGSSTQTDESNPAPPRQPLGRVVATERRPSTPHEFHFWTALDAAVGIGTLVRVDGGLPINGTTPRVYGVVVEAYGYTDLQSPLHDVMGFDGSPANAALAPTERTEIRLFTAAVLRQLPEEPLQPVPMGTVYLADDDDVTCALRMDGYVAEPHRTAIPIGVYHAGGIDAPVHLDADFLLGPEAAHLAVTGVSGLATKTSAVEWLLASIFAHFPPAKESIAAVCFNVKGSDLCFLDQPATDLSPADLALYEKLGVPPTPFARVRYFAPYRTDGYTLATLRSHESLADSVTPLAWGLREVMEYADVLLNREDVDAKADALIDFIRERVVGREFKDPLLSTTYRVQSFSDLERWFRDLLESMEQRDQDSWRTHHVATLRKIRNRLLNIAQRCAGLVTNAAEASDLPWGSFQDRTVYVIDVANLEQDAQDLIFARVVSQLRTHLERRSLGVKHVVVFVDELNCYAPTDGPETYVRKMLLDLAERGRYLGLVLFGAQQFRSQVHRRVVGNAGTAVFGRMDADELASPGYAVLSPAIRTKLATLEKGQLMVRHPHFTQPIFVRFPRPPVLSGREGVERFPAAPEVPLAVALTRRLRRLDPRITHEWVKRLTELYEPGEVLEAGQRAELVRPENVRAFVEAQLGRIIPGRLPSQPELLVQLRTLPPVNPYGV
jgi:uncharacterized protein